MWSSKAQNWGIIFLAAAAGCLQSFARVTENVGGTIGGSGSSETPVVTTTDTGIATTTPAILEESATTTPPGLILGESTTTPDAVREKPEPRELSTAPSKKNDCLNYGNKKFHPHTRLTRQHTTYRKAGKQLGISALFRPQNLLAGSGRAHLDCGMALVHPVTRKPRA